MATPKNIQQDIPTPQVEARIDRLVDGDFKTKAYASATIAGAFAVHGIRIIESDKGRFVSMPQESYQKHGQTKLQRHLPRHHRRSSDSAGGGGQYRL